jgi:hypothetical protein
VTAPAFCACCTEPRKGLTPVQSKSKGATRAARVTWLCLDCVDMGTLADLAQHDIRDAQRGGAEGGSVGGMGRGKR